MIRSPDLLKTLIGMTFSLSPKTPEVLRPRWHLQTPIYYQFLRGSGNKSQPIQSTLTAFGNPSGNRLHPLTQWSCTTVFLYGYHMTQSRGSDLPGPSHYAQNGCPRRTEPALSGGIARTFILRWDCLSLLCLPFDSGLVRRIPRLGRNTARGMPAENPYDLRLARQPVSFE